jgi:hypothetical protein
MLANYRFLRFNTNISEPERRWSYSTSFEIYNVNSMTIILICCELCIISDIIKIPLVSVDITEFLDFVYC